MNCRKKLRISVTSNSILQAMLMVGNPSGERILSGLLLGTAGALVGYHAAVPPDLNILCNI